MSGITADDGGVEIDLEFIHLLLLTQALYRMGKVGIRLLGDIKPERINILLAMSQHGPDNVDQSALDTLEGLELIYCLLAIMPVQCRDYKIYHLIFRNKYNAEFHLA